MRGIVISPATITGKNSMTFNGGIDPVKLRKYLLYWDKIDFPSNNMISFSGSPETEFLKSSGILKETNVQIPFGGEMTALYVWAQLKALELNNVEDKGSWTLGQENMELVLPITNLL